MTEWKFGNVIFCGLVLSAIILSIIGIDRICGIREGTIAAAVLVGAISRLINNGIKCKLPHNINFHP